MAFTNYIVNTKQWIRYRYWKFLQRFLAVWLALLFLGFVPNFLSPGQALVGDPNPPSYTKPVLQIIQEGLEATVEEAEADPELLPLLDNPFVIVGLVALNVGVAWYFYSQAQQQAAQKLAQQKYCVAYPSDSVCTPFTGGQLPILYDVYYSFHFETGPYTGNLDNQPPNYRALQVYGPIRNFGAIRPVSFDPNNPTYDYILGISGSWDVYNRNGFGFCPFVLASDQKGNPANYESWFGGCADAANYNDHTGDHSYPGSYYFHDISITPSQGQPDTGGNPPPLNWKDWSQDKRNAAVGMLTDDDWLSNLQQSPQGGVLPPGAVLPKGHYSFPSDGSVPSHSPGPETVPNNSSTSPPPPPEPEPEPEPGAGGAMQGGGFVGRRGKPIQILPGTNQPTVINGREYSGHAVDRMQQRGIPASVVENAIQTGTQIAGRDGTTLYYDPLNDITVVTNATTGRVVTVLYSAPSGYKP